MARQSAEKLVSVEIEHGIAYLRIDVKGQSVNTLSTPMLDRFEEILGSLQHDATIEGVVIFSGKQDNFVAGFDIEELLAFRDNAPGLRALVQRGQSLMASLEALSVPVVAAIDGACLGGGLELALACHGRVASENPKTRLGLPEVQLGLIPGGGGTQRLPRRVELSVALDMILTGRELSATKARREGLVDDVVHPGILLEVAAKLVRELAEHPRKDRALTEAFTDPVKLAARTPARKLVFNRAREGVLEQSGGHYPAPLRALDVIEQGFADGFESGIEAEGRAFVELVPGDVAQNLMNIFFMRQEVNSDSVVAKQVKPLEVGKIGVIGAGLMGAGIAQLAAYENYIVRLKDANDTGLGWGLNYIKGQFDGLADRRRLTEDEADVAFGRVSGTTGYSGFKTAELVIEAVFENLELKQQVLAEIEALGNSDQIFASNTSTLPIGQIAKKSKRPENVLGMHFFSPVHKMPLLEIVRTEATSDVALATALDVGRQMGKTCIVVEDGPGFFTSRVIGAYINEAGWVLQEGGRIEDIDQAMVEFGFPVGPLKLVDEVGIDVAIRAAKVLQEAFPDRWRAPESLAALANAGRKGRKNHHGFYLYNGSGNGHGKKVDESVYGLLASTDRRLVDRELVQQRCWLAMLNECAYALDEKIVRHARDVDIGVIFGLGFPPFRGGILRYADSIGLDRIAHQLNQLADLFGERLRPAPLIVEKAKRGQSFYG
ncbi:MAG: enoyl-CoA hydratase/isomerase family protein [Bradymonadaceae bacterium]|nr:enoyl-CoA hydratase/isomerase family protein [Lujinxingiaceae bacterium]